MGSPDLRECHDIAGVLSDGGLAQFGDSLLNFAFSLALTEMLGRPKGTKIPDRVLADAAVKAGLRKFLPKRVGRGDVANSVEALLGYAWLQKLLTLGEIVGCLKTDSLDRSHDFAKLAGLALERLNK